MITFQELLNRLTQYWQEQDCIIHHGYDMEMGAGTFNPATFLRALGPEPYRAAYIEPCRRPSDGRYGENPNRVQHYFQYQVIIKPSPANIQELYLNSLKAIGLDLSKHDIRFVHDDWENPTIGAWGLGWEVWMDGMEVTQFTYFQSLGGLPLSPVTVELTYGLERLAMYIQNVDNLFDLQWDKHLVYGDIYHRSEVEWSRYNFEEAATEMWFRHFNDFEAEASRLIEAQLPLPAYDFVMKSSHAFNMLDARGAISVTERTGYITRIRNLARKIAESYLTSREQQQFPLMKRFSTATPPSHRELPFSSFTNNPSATSTFLLEIGSEELPATFVPIGMRNLEKAVAQLLDNAGISYTAIHPFGTPRRLSLSIHGLALGSAEKIEKRKGPTLDKAFDDNGAPTAAAEGFFRSIQKAVVSLNELENDGALFIEEVNGKKYLFAQMTIPGIATGDLLAEQLPKIIEALEFPKKMRWADHTISYARPLRWIVSLLGAEIVPFQVANIRSDRVSYGHRQLNNQAFSLIRADDYVALLKKYSVLVDPQEREKSILAQLIKAEQGLHGTIIEQKRVMPQVLYLSEWPQILIGSFKASYLEAPKEVLISEMIEHQKYFPVSDDLGKLKNQFVIVADNTPSDEIRKGNERVLSARLSDGVFLYEQGKKRPFIEYNQKLKQVTYQKALGSVYDKVERLVQHAALLQKELSIGTAQQATRAALLAKADLATEMVYEFPELQGTIGKYYALASGEEQEVAVAIEEQWMPTGEAGALPTTATGTLLSLTDKIDNLLGCFAIGLRPTSSSDPYALRRQTLGMVRILINQKLHLNLPKILQGCFAHFPENIRTENKEAVAEVLAFFMNRIKTIFLAYNFSKDEIEAALSENFEDIYDAFQRVQALHAFRQSGSHFEQLFEVYKRAKGQILNHEALPFEQTLLVESAEKNLHQILSITEEQFTLVLKEKDYQQAYSLLAQMQPALAELFDHVKILANENEIRLNRIALLQRVFNLFARLLDFSKIQEA